jgi:hypothetical protein
MNLKDEYANETPTLIRVEVKRSLASSEGSDQAAVSVTPATPSLPYSGATAGERFTLSPRH